MGIDRWGGDRPDGFIPTETVIVWGNYVEHFNGNVGVASTVISFSTASKSILIENTHASNTLFVSFDGGVSWKTIMAGYSLSIDISIPSLSLLGSGINTSYEMLVVEQV